MKSTGRVTIPTDESFVEGTKEIMKKWGADAVRDCDGTSCPQTPKNWVKYIIRILSCAETTRGRGFTPRKRNVYSCSVSAFWQRRTA